MKTVKIYIKMKFGIVSPSGINACGLCFSEVRGDDKFCFECGAEFVQGINHFAAWNYEELEQSLASQKEKI